MHLTRLLMGAKKLPMITAKRGNKNFYKGRQAPAPGFHSRYGGYVVDQARVETITFSVPDLTGFALKAYVSPLVDQSLNAAASTPAAAK